MLLRKNQLTFGVVPLGDGCLSAQSAKSVMPLSIANCREKRSVLILTFESPSLKSGQIELLNMCFSISIDQYAPSDKWKPNLSVRILCK